MSQSLSYDVFGSGPGLVMVHGTGTSGLQSWQPVVGQLAAEYTVLLPNLPGSGQSPLPGGPLDLDTITDQILATAQEAGLERFALAGASLGVPVAIKVAARHPERVSRLITVCGYAWPRPTLRLSLELWAAMQARQDKDTGKLLAMLSYSEEYLSRLPGEQLQQVIQSMGANSGPGTAAQIGFTLRIDVRADLAKVQAPTLILAPGGDRFVPPIHSRELAEGIPGARIAEIDGGHAAIYEDHRQILSALQEFLRTDQ